MSFASSRLRLGVGFICEQTEKGYVLLDLKSSGEWLELDQNLGAFFAALDGRRELKEVLTNLRTPEKQQALRRVLPGLIERGYIRVDDSPL